MYLWCVIGLDVNENFKGTMPYVFLILTSSNVGPSSDAVLHMSRIECE